MVFQGIVSEMVKLQCRQNCAQICIKNDRELGKMMAPLQKARPVVQACPQALHSI